MRTREPLALSAALLLAVTSGCTTSDRLPGRDPDVTGVVERIASGDPVLTEPSDDYFDGMSLTRGDPLVVRSDDGASPSAELQDGDVVDVWTGDICTEPIPVQCEIVAVHATG